MANVHMLLYSCARTIWQEPITSPFAAAFAADQVFPGGGPSPLEATAEPEERSPFESVEEQPDGQSPPETPEERSPFEPVEEQSPLAQSALPGQSEVAGQSEAAGSLEGPPLHFSPSGPMSQTVIERELVSREEPELVLVREVTFGGLTRLASGQVRRTYFGTPPAMCPT